MARPKKKYAHCPCCSLDKDRTEMKIAMDIMEQLDRKSHKYYVELDIDPYNRFIDARFDWACDSCLKSKKAIQSSPGSQRYAWEPKLAYFDSHLVCRTCKTDFIFSAEEKKLWYEKLKFWIDSAPVNCLKCRKKVRTIKQENKTLSDILQREETELSIEELTIVSDIYRKWENVEKAKYYDAVIRKKLKKQKNL